jgi:hypothetical protein
LQVTTPKLPVHLGRHSAKATRLPIAGIGNLPGGILT